MNKYKYNIDGLRAISVLLVLFYHVKLPLFSGGFIGVDVFFVISGFLITKIIYPKIKSGTFSYYDFYNKRIKRILPIFYLVLFSTI
ncbi:acyltransferase, partial [Vibrio parahaemolyticus]|nr:acyltransferase [Vibrio parahaemolyticus]